MSENERSSTFRQPLLALMASLAAFMAIFSCVVPEPSSTSVLAAKTDRVQDRLWYFARSPFAREPLSVIRGPDGRIARVCYLIPRHKGANLVGPGRGRKSTRPGANGVVELSPLEFLDRLADLVPPPCKRRHWNRGVFAASHTLRQAVTSHAIGNIGDRVDAATGGHAVGGYVAGGCCSTSERPHSYGA